MSDDFVNDAVEFLRSERKRRDAETSRLALEQQLKETKCPAFWNEVRQSVKKICDQIEADMKESLFNWPAVIPNNELTLTSSAVPGRRQLEAKYDPNTHEITFVIRDGAGGRFVPYVSNAGCGYSEDNQDVSPDQVGQRMVSSLLGRRG